MLFLFLLLMAGLCFALGVGILCLATAAAMVALGIVSVSLLVGVLRRSVSAGLRAFCLQAGALGGAACGAVGTFVVLRVAGSRGTLEHWTVGVVLGVVFGVLSAWVFNMIWRRVAYAVSRRFSKEN